MSDRVTTDDLALAELAIRHEAETYNENDDDTEAALLRVADWVYRERMRRYRRMGERSWALRGPFGIHARQLGDVQ